MAPKLLTNEEALKLPIGTVVLAQGGEYGEKPVEALVQAYQSANPEQREEYRYFTTAAHVMLRTTEPEQRYSAAKLAQLNAERYQPLARPRRERFQHCVPNAISYVYTGASGADPEFFIRNGRELVPAFKFLPSKKSGQSAFWDGFQAEFTTVATGCMERQSANLQAGILDLLSAAKAKFPDANLSHESVVEIPEQQLAEADENQVALGCAPSKNIYGHKGLEVENPRELKIRFAGGHMHFGCAGAFQTLPNVPGGGVEGAVSCLDASLGLMMVSMAAGFDDPRRRQYYGLAGEHRLPAHGLEYRTLSNFHLTHPALNYLAYDIGRMAVKIGLLGMRKIFSSKPLEVAEIIDASDVSAARRVLKRDEKLWRDLIAKKYYWIPENGQEELNHKSLNKTWAAILEGPGVVKIDPTRVAANWQALPTWRATVGQA
jgi:hypothetical protein